MMVADISALKDSGIYSPDVYLNYQGRRCSITVKHKDEPETHETISVECVGTFLHSDLAELKGSRVFGIVTLYHNHTQQVRNAHDLLNSLSINFKSTERQFEAPFKLRRIYADSNNQSNNKLTVSPKFNFETRKSKRILIKHEHLSLGEDFKGGFDILNLLTVNYHGWLVQVQDAVKDLVPGDVVVVYQSGFGLTMYEAINNIASYTPKPTVLQYRIEDSKVLSKFVLSLIGNLRNIEVTEADKKFFGEIKETLKKDMYFDPFA